VTENDQNQACLPLQDFDREFNLGELMSGINAEKLLSTLVRMLGEPIWISACNGNCVIGAAQNMESVRLPIRVQMDLVGHLHVSPRAGAQGQAAVAWLEMLLHSSVRYLMASSLHLQAVNEDYEQLKQQHAALLASERRYKELSEGLEQRVAEQVRTIEATQRQLYQTEKLASVGQLAAGVAHEINNPIGFVKSNLATAQTYLQAMAGLVELTTAGAAPDKIQSYLEDEDVDFVMTDFQVLLQESIAGAERIAVIVQELKGFSAIDKNAEEACDINDIIRNTCNIVLPELTGPAQLRLDLADLPAVICNPGHLGQAFMNLLQNAIKAIDKNGRILVETRLERDRVLVKFADTGVGINHEIMDKIFDPFFTTKEVGQGTGLGLAVVRDIVKCHGGEIRVASRQGKGSIFTLSLPLPRGH
jgi:signal transduction histidine kinase